MSARDVETLLCHRCSAEVAVADRFCRRCGTLLGSGAGRAARPQRPRLVERRGFVLLMLFAAIGPLALPWLWRSREFARPWKLVLTVAVTVLTAVVIWLLWIVVRVFLGQLADLGAW